MSYLDELEKMSVSELLKQSCHRIDGLTMYFVCAIFTLFAAYSAFAGWFGWPLSVPYWKGFWISLLLVPITFIMYISFIYYSAPGMLGRVINAFLLFCIPIIVAYKFF